MKTRLGVIAAAAMLVAAPLALAQTGTGTTTTRPSTGATTTSPSTSTMGTSGSSTATMDHSAIEKRLQSEGYSNVNLKEDTSKRGEWTGTAMKGGKTVNIHVDPSGKVSER